jgi:hypothetical protein
MMAASLFFRLDVQADTAYTMVNDHHLYNYSEYRAEKQYDEVLQIKVIDERHLQGGRQSKAKPLVVTDDTFWMEPVPDMLERVLLQEFGLSFLFRKVGRKDTPRGLILELVLSSFHGHVRRVGVMGRSIFGEVAFSARLFQQKPRKTLFTKDYHSHTNVKLKSIVKSGRGVMVRQIGKSLEEVIPVLISDVEGVVKEARRPKKARISPRKKPKPINLEPVGPK